MRLGVPTYVRADSQLLIQRPAGSSWVPTEFRGKHVSQVNCQCTGTRQ